MLIRGLLLGRFVLSKSESVDHMVALAMKRLKHGFELRDFVVVIRKIVGIVRRQFKTYSMWIFRIIILVVQHLFWRKSNCL